MAPPPRMVERGGYTSSAFCFGTKALTLKEFASSAKEESESFVRPAFPLVFTNLGSKNVNVINAKSLKKYAGTYEPTYAIRTSTRNFGFENGIKSIPLYALFTL